MPNINRTLAELNTAIKTEMQLDPGLISDVERKQFINDCLSDIGTIGLLEKSGQVVIEFGFGDLPDNIVEIIDVTYNKRVLAPMEVGHSGIGTEPVGYISLFNRIGTVPQVASCTLDLYYSYRPTPLVLDTDQPDIPNGYDKLLLDWAVGHAHRKNGNIGLYREYMGAYNEGKQALTMELTKRANSRVTYIHNIEYMENPSTPFDFI